jgi:hypothetical protein
MASALNLPAIQGGEFRRMREQSSRILKSAPQAVP